jgi:hypothetical protein
MTDATALAFSASSLQLPARTGSPPRVDVRYPCLQLEDRAPEALRDRLLEIGRVLPGVTVRATELAVPGDALVLDEELARGKPEGFVRGGEFAIVREEGSVHVNLDPLCGQHALDRGWATIHPLARYMAGALPPQSLVVYAPRSDHELGVVAQLLHVAYGFAVGRFGDVLLPDSAW